MRVLIIFVINLHFKTHTCLFLKNGKIEERKREGEKNHSPLKIQPSINVLLGHFSKYSIFFFNINLLPVQFCIFN